MVRIVWKNSSKPPLCSHSIQSYGFNRFVERIRSWSSSNSALCCLECEKEEMDKSSKKTKTVTFGAKFLWVCLDCDRIFCGAQNIGQPGTHIHSHAIKNNHLLAIPMAAWCHDCKSTQQIMAMETNKELGSAVEVKNESGGVRQGNLDNSPADYVVRPMPNLGNSCFFNAIVQNLLSMRVLRHNFMKLNCQSRSITHDLYILFLDTDDLLEDDVDLMGHADLFDSLCQLVPSFQGHKEHDSHELLRQLLSLLLAEGTNFIQDIFGGKLSSTVSCVRCGNAKKSYEPFLDLSLAIPSNERSTKKDEVVTPKVHAPSAVEISSLQEECLSEETTIVLPGTESVDLSSQVSSVKRIGCSRKRIRLSPLSSLMKQMVCSRKRPRSEGQEQSGNDNGDPSSIEKCLDLFTAPEVLFGECVCDHCSNHLQDSQQTELQSTSKNEKFKEDEVRDEVKPAIESNDEGVDIGSRTLLRPSDRYDHYVALLGDEVKIKVESKEEGVDVGSRKAEMKASKRYLIFKAPLVLTIHLKRFTRDTNGIMKKINSSVSIQEMLDLTTYMDPSCEDKEKPRYRLIGVVEHVGAALMGGHYVAYVRGVRSQEHEITWFRASDNVVRKASLDEVLNSGAYILFYERMQS